MLHDDEGGDELFFPSVLPCARPNTGTARLDSFLSPLPPPPPLSLFLSTAQLRPAPVTPLSRSDDRSR